MKEKYSKDNVQKRVTQQSHRRSAGLNEKYEWVLSGRKYKGCAVQTAPIKALTAAIAVTLVFSFEGHSALRTDRETGKPMQTTEAAYVRYRHGVTKCKLLLNLRSSQQVIRRQIESNTELFKRQD